jgi:pimeloyl-ACP methyl ester carboxylesterase
MNSAVVINDPAGAARQFAEALEPRLWAEFPPEFRQTMIGNSPAFRDEVSDPNFYVLDLERICDFQRPVLLTHGDQSPPQYAPVITRLAEALPPSEVNRFRGAGHIPHMEQPEAYVEAISAFIGRHTA